MRRRTVFTLTEPIRALLHDLKDCTKRRDLKGGREAHARARESGSQLDSCIATALVNMYAKCGSLVEASSVFEQMTRPSVVSWTILMLGYVDNGQSHQALQLFSRMQHLGCSPDERAYAVALKACTALAVEQETEHVNVNVLEVGLDIHSEAARRGYDRDIFVSNTAIGMFAKFGKMVEARRVFDNMHHRNAVSWTVLILGYADNQESEVALEMLARMLAEQASLTFEPDAVVYVAAVKACASLAARRRSRGESMQDVADTGMEIHRLAALKGGLDIVFYNTLVDMFAKCGKMEEAKRTFMKMPQHSVVSCTVLILGYVECGQADRALGLFETMTACRACRLDALAIVAALKACAAVASREKGEIVSGKIVIKLSSLDKGMRIHSYFHSHTLTQDYEYHRVENSLMDMYAQCHSLLDARMVFDKMFNPGLVSWNALLLAYTDCGEPELALHLFGCMQSRNVGHDAVTLVAALKACASTADLESAKAVHALALQSRRFDWKSQEELDNSLVDVYGKCGSMANSQLVFDSLATTNSFNWSALIAGYSRKGECTNRVFHLFACMHAHGLKPDGVSFLSLLTACSHAGEVSKGEHVFREMKDKYGISPEFEHYRCMIDMLGRSNQLDAAVGLAKSMPFEANEITWRTILGACSKWKNVRVARLAFEQLVEIDERDEAAYHLMENICASLGLWDEHSQVEAARRSKARSNG